MKATKILLTSDLSEESLRAFEPMADMAIANKATVTLLHVVEDVPVIAHGAPLAPPMLSLATPEHMESAKLALVKQAASLPAELETSTEVLTAAKVGEAVADYATENGIDLIALSSHGRSGFKRLFLGSVAENILRHASCPVLVFPRND